MARFAATRFVAQALTAALVGLTAAAAAAQGFPSKPIRIIVNTAPGGLVDVTTRLVAQKMSERLGQLVNVENQAGGGGLVGIRAVKNATPDGYTVLASAGTIAIQQVLKDDAGYDIAKDFAPVGPMVRSPLIIMVGAPTPYKSYADFAAQAKAQAGKLSYASAGVGTTTHLAAAKWAQQAGLDLLHVPYKGNGAAMPDVMSGRVEMIFEAYGSGAAKVKDGLLRALAVTSTSRLPGLPDVPTLAEAGLPGFSFYLWMGLMAPGGTPKEVVATLSDALRSSIGSRDIAERLKADGSEALAMSPQDFTEFLKRDLTQVSSLVKELAIPKQ
jgi:tripartite-type tricarboxylate transporter receptor subunit TctC